MSERKTRWGIGSYPSEPEYHPPIDTTCWNRQTPSHGGAVFDSGTMQVGHEDWRDTEELDEYDLDEYRLDDSDEFDETDDF